MSGGRRCQKNMTPHREDYFGEKREESQHLDAKYYLIKWTELKKNSS